MILNIWVKCMKKNTNKLEKIVIILLFIIIIAIGAYFNNGEELFQEDIYIIDVI